MQTLAALCVRRPVFATMLVLSLVVVGGFSFTGLGVDLLPRIDVPTVAVSVANPGASAEQIESEITKRLEGAVNTISGIDELRSTSVQGLSQVTVTFLLEKDGDVAAQEIRDRVNRIVPELPEGAQAPIIQKFDPDAMPVLQLVVAGERPLRELTRLADDQIKEALESISGVGEVRLVGGTDREIQVRVNPERMRALGVTIGDITTALRQQNVELPGGRVTEGSRELTVRTMGKLLDVSAFADIAIATRGSYAVRLGDVAEVIDGQQELRSASFLDDRPAVTLVISKQSGQNTVAVAHEVKARLAALAATLPPDVRTTIVNDQSVFIEAAVNSLEHHLVLGSFFAAIVIFFFLANWRTTLIAALAIPTSIIATFTLMKLMGYTLNQITMLALTLMVGVVIDDAIIVLENIYRFIEEKGMRPIEAAVAGTKEIGLAVMATTLSLLAVFVPVGFMGGIVGRFMSSFGLTAAFAIAVSLLVSFTLTPMLCARFLKPQAATDAERTHSSKQSIVFRPIERAYMAMLRWSMRHRLVMVGLSVAVIISIVPLFMGIGKNFTPDDDRSEFQVSIKTPEGSGLAATSTVLARIARDVRAFPEVVGTLTSVGGGAQGAVNAGTVLVRLSARNERTATQQDVMTRVRALVETYPGDLRVSVGTFGGPGGGGASLQFALTGPDLEQLGRASAQLLERAKAIPYVVDADTSLVVGKPELRVEIDRKRAADLGVRVQDVAQAVNTFVAGQKVSTFDVGDNQYDVTLRAAEQFRDSGDALTQIAVASSKRGLVTLGEIVRIEPAAGPSSITRVNRQRQVTLSMNLATGGSQSEALAQLTTAAAGLNLPAGYAAGPAGGSKELARAAYYFVVAIALSFIFMYIVLAAQFESFLHPITILLTLPLAVPFGILSLYAAGLSINVFSGLGLLLLFGIVKKNAILQIDHTNGLRAAGRPRLEAILEANRDRLRPILMTTIALVAGMLPLVFSNDAGAATNRSIGVLVVGGQTLCLLLTLLAVPVFYSLFDDLGTLTVWSRLGRQRAAVGTRISTPAARLGGHTTDQLNPVAESRE